MRLTITNHVIDVMWSAGLIMSPLALLALFRRTRLSKILGWIAISCFVIAIIALIINWQRMPSVFDFAYFAAFLLPGAIAIVFNRAPHRKPGHCATCGYNLTGNVSGKCSECGEPVVAP